MIETERCCEHIEEIQHQYLKNDHEDISCYEAIALWFSEWVGDNELYKMDQQPKKKGEN
jgi:hypothetical protein